MWENLIFKLMKMYLHGNRFQSRGKERKMDRYDPYTDSFIVDNSNINQFHVRTVQLVELTDECIEKIVNKIAEATADVVEVVRCKDCKHSKMADYIPAKCPYFCKLMANCHSGDFFCSMGERREDDC